MMIGQPGSACVLTQHGLGPNSKTGIYLHNSKRNTRKHITAFGKLRGCPVNVNYRYREEELIYLLDNSDAQALIFQAAYGDRIDAIRNQLNDIRCLIQIDDDSGNPLLEGAIAYEDAIAGATPMPRIERKLDDLYMLYTGGTTGLPKGVMYASGIHSSNFSQHTANLGVTPSVSVEDLPGNITEALQDNGLPVGLICCPLMHGTGMWVGSMITHLAGGAAVTVKNLVWTLICSGLKCSCTEPPCSP